MGGVERLAAEASIDGFYFILLILCIGRAGFLYGSHHYWLGGLVVLLDHFNVLGASYMAWKLVCVRFMISFLMGS